MDIECDGCGTEFDTQREHPAGPYASTTRCPSCGHDHDVDEPEAAVAVDGADEQVRIQVGDVTIAVDPGAGGEP